MMGYRQSLRFQTRLVILRHKFSIPTHVWIICDELLQCISVLAYEIIHPLSDEGFAAKNNTSMDILLATSIGLHFVTVQNM